MKRYGFGAAALIAVVLAACTIDSEPEAVRVKSLDVDLAQSHSTRSTAIVPDASAWTGKYGILFPDDIGTGGRIPGYWHTRERSRFARGMGARSFDDRASVVRREVSANGLFLEFANGFSAGIPNGDAESWRVAPYSNDSAVHERRVVQYFLESGLPQDQVGETSLNTWMQFGGPSMAVGPDGKSLAAQVVKEKKLTGYVTIVHLGLPAFLWTIRSPGLS